MSSFGHLFLVESRRCLSRRAVHVLIGIALLGSLLTGVVGVLVGGDIDLSTSGSALIRLSDLWKADDPVLGMPVIFLLIGAVIGGAVVVGGEWKAGTVPTVLTWEPRRLRLLAARLAACGALAMLIALALLVVFVLVGVLPGFLAHGEVGDIDAGWWVSLAGGVGRSLFLIGLAALLGGAIANIGRSTTAALVVVFAYEAVLEQILRGVWPSRAGWLLSENAAAWITGERLVGEEFERSVAAGGATLGLYVAMAVGLALVVFERRDVAAA
jgi:hypothetical protein